MLELFQQQDFIYYRILTMSVKEAFKFQIYMQSEEELNDPQLFKFSELEDKSIIFNYKTFIGGAYKNKIQYNEEEQNIERKRVLTRKLNKNYDIVTMMKHSEWDHGNKSKNKSK